MDLQITAEQKRKVSSILYLHEYRHVPEDIVRWKNDEELHPWEGENIHETGKSLPQKLWVGIGTYNTIQDGEIYLCVLIDPASKEIVSYSFGVYRSFELVGRSLDRLPAVHENANQELTVLSSRNPIYRSKPYQNMMTEYKVHTEMTKAGTRGGAAPVSTFFSQLMRKKGGHDFQTWQDAIDWLSRYIYYYNVY